MAVSRPGANWAPYLLGGWAQLDHDADDVPGTEVLNGAEFGLGVRKRLGGDNANFSALRLELRDVMSNLTPSFPNDDAVTHNLIATVGLQIGFGRSSRDSDGDGVRDRDDACPDTPSGATIDATGCPTDSDGDGVFDGIDQCAGTPAGATVDASGCPADSDGDGVFDGIDRCADTPAGALVDASGCPTDSDGDGVFDGIDQCADTPANLQVDAAGCPIAVTETEIQLLDTGVIATTNIAFASGSAQLDPAHSPILDEIAETMVRWPELKLGIVGHTDDTGSAASNQKLSEKRAQAVLDYVIPYVNERKAFGEPVSNRQSVAFSVSDIAIETGGMRLANWRAASRSDRGDSFHREAALARRLAAAKGMDIGSAGVQLLGGHGYVKEHPVERWYRDLRAAGVMEGALLA